MLLGILAGEDDISRLLVDYPLCIRVICIQLHGGIEIDVNRIPELDALDRRCGQSNRNTTFSGINTPQPICSVFHLRILFEQNGIVIADVQIAVGINRPTVGLGGVGGGGGG